MPTYAYACTECDHRFDAVQAFSDTALTECPECTGRLRKLFSAVGIVFKGSGFYRTDSRKAASSSSGTSSDKSSDKSEKAPAAASPSSSSSSSSDSGSKSNPSSSGTGTTSSARAAI